MNSFISRIIWILVAILSVKSIDCSSHRKPKKQPHIILIVADDLVSIISQTAKRKEKILEEIMTERKNARDKSI